MCCGYLCNNHRIVCIIIDSIESNMENYGYISHNNIDCLLIVEVRQQERDIVAPKLDPIRNIMDLNPHISFFRQMISKSRVVLLHNTFVYIILFLILLALL